MEFKFAVNSILKNEITKIKPAIIVPGFSGDKREIREHRRQLSEMIDAIGERSAIVQGLNKTITTAEKLEVANDQTVYLMKDSRGNNGKGELIGLLKVGKKTLYLNDPFLDKVKQVDTLCILDFYVIETRQRSGYGKFLFDFMLNDQKVKPAKLAIDAPSPKLIAFMDKHYDVIGMVKQMNNYAIGPNFFCDEEWGDDVQTEHGNSVYKPSSRNSSGHSTPSMSQLSYGRFAAPRPACSIASVIHGEVPESPASTSSAPVTRRYSTMPDPIGYDVEQWDTPEHEVRIPDKSLLESAVRPSSLPVEPEQEEHLAIEVDSEEKATSEPRSVSPAGSSTTRRDSQLTEQGYFDIKFYHVKLW